MKLYSILTVILHLIIHYKLHHIIHAYLLGTNRTIVSNYLVQKYQMLRNATISELSQSSEAPLQMNRSSSNMQ